MSKRIRVGAVSYLNTKPLLWGIKRSAIIEKIELIEDYPSRLAEMLISNEIDLGLVPAAVIPNIPNNYIIGNYCIGAEKKVASVALFSKVPLEEVETLLLDYQSKTSITLARILLKYYWKKEVTIQNAPHHFIDLIENKTAGIIIGDRALEQLSNFPFVYDLAANWIQFTQKPFVFAAWVSNKPLDETFIQEFDAANSYGLNHLEQVIAENPFPLYDLMEYYTENISYLLTETKRQGLQLFLDYIKEL